jgi:ferredoxin
MNARKEVKVTARLLSVNVGLPRDIAWQGRTVHTAVWKAPVEGPRVVRRLNIDGDGQGDLAGHGGEHRAVFVYQIDSYRYWQNELGRNDFTYGQFGENFTVDGLPDREVCIGDRYRIGSALFEVTQPRVTCYRVGIQGRLDMGLLREQGVPRNADFFVCGPSAFISDLTAGLGAWGVPTGRIHTELFGPGSAITPEVVATSTHRPPHLPAGPAGAGPLVSFARSGLHVQWGSTFRSLLELAEACDIPTRWACRAGVCHTCETGLVAGRVSYQPNPIDPPAAGNVLICCSQPDNDVVIDL